MAVRRKTDEQDIHPGFHRLSAPLMLMTLAIMALGLWLPQGALAGYFKLTALPAAFNGWLVAILLGYCTLTSVMKRIYIRRYGWQ